jgi:hypothetical protein
MGAPRAETISVHSSAPAVHLHAGVGVQNAVHQAAASPFRHALQAQAEGVFRQGGCTPRLKRQPASLAIRTLLMVLRMLMKFQEAASSRTRLLPA